MKKDSLLALFYQEVIKEASTGRVECSTFPYNMLFKTKIEELGIETDSSIQQDNLLVPTLMIRDVPEFNQLLLEYTEEMYPTFSSDCKEILTLLWSDATPEDFQDPKSYLKRRISFLKDDRLFRFDNTSFFSSILDSEVNLHMERSQMGNETPYHLEITLTRNNDSFRLPNVYLGLADDRAYLYAIQNPKNSKNEGPYAKEINRLLYQGNAFFDAKEDNFEHYDVGNLRDVSMPFLLACNITMGLLNHLGIHEILTPSILVERWNAKELSNERKKEAGLLVNPEEHERIQSNLTEKLIRTCARVAYHHSSMQLTSLPYENDSFLHLRQEGEDYSENPLLQETYSFSLEKQKFK